MIFYDRQKSCIKLRQYFSEKIFIYCNDILFVTINVCKSKGKLKNMASTNIISLKIKKKINNTRLALDIGTNSIGWALYKINKNRRPSGIIKVGVRIFSSGRKAKDYTTLNATRRESRLQRRQRDCYLQRRTYLLHLLKKHGFFPTFSAKKLQCLNPYELRTKGLDEKLDIYHFGRVLFHINQRRGFKSNRKSGNKKEDGLISNSVKAAKELMQKQQARTYGEFLWKRFQKMEKSRKTPGSQQENWILARRAVGAGARDNYAVYANRKMLEEEFNKLWDSQACFHVKLQDKGLKDKFFKAIFYQRPLKKTIIGECQLIAGEKRIARALPSFQKFRILKELNNLSYVDFKRRSHPINKLNKGKEFRDTVVKELFFQKEKVTFSALEKAFRKFFPQIEDFSQFNLEAYNREYLEGEKTAVILRKIIPEWSNWSLEVQDRFIERLEGESREDLFMKDDEEVLNDLKKINIEHNLNLSSEQIKNCLDKLSQLPIGHAMYSKKAITKILPFLEQGQLEYEAVPSAGYGHHSDKEYKGDLLNQLPPYPEVLSSHCVEINKDKRIPNPTVHIAFNQLRLLINDIIRVYGVPLQIVLETARDLPLGEKSKKELEKRNYDNKKANEEAQQVIEEFNQRNNRNNRIRYRLWREQKENCIYTGKNIPKSKLYSSEVEVDHILPWSRTLDDGFSNKVLVYKSTNQNKGNKTPFEFFSTNDEWGDILSRVKELPKNKQWRFDEKALDQFLNGEKDFLARQLNDTRYITRCARQYLKRISSDVWTVRGQTTAMLRGLLQHEKKNRDDFRNHAKDALIIGLIDCAFIQKISNLSKKSENIQRNIKDNLPHLIWSNFKEDAKKSIDSVVVSHRKRTKKEGKLHNDTAYGISSNTTDFSKAIDVIHYVGILSLDKIKIKKIISDKTRKDFAAEVKNNNELSKEFLKNYHQKTGIRRIRLKEKKTIICIKDKAGKIYKVFNGDSNYAVELFIDQGKWDSYVVDRFTANQKCFNPIPVKNRLMAGDMLFFDNKFWRLIKFNQRKQLIFSEHFEANVDTRNRNSEYKYTYLQPSTLQQKNPRRVDISPSGIIKLTKFNFTVKKKLVMKKQKV